ncbi:MAG: hypothetical protein PHE18_05140 [Candidatus Omnitrophica bacterium]|nr:hypothetical protein [Candidatus Omnitrophota bacterium]MDD5553243.1 hypothetical protein [Candidatus Omnitrophota bacterium]
MKKDWIRELARDLIALGSIPFLILTIARVSVLRIYYPMQFILSSSAFFALNVFFKGEMRSGIGMILLVFTSIYYNRIFFTLFALFIYAGMIVSLFYLRRGRKQILTGVFLGAVCSGAGYAIVRLIFFGI